MKRRARAVALGLITIAVVVGMADYLLHAVLETQSVLPTLFVGFPSAAFLGAIVCAHVAGNDLKVAGIVYGFVFCSWLSVPIFTLLDRPSTLVACGVLLANVAAAVTGNLVGKLTLPFGSRFQTPAAHARQDSAPMGSLFGRSVAFVGLGAAAFYFLWLSYENESFFWAIPAVTAYVYGRSAVETPGADRHSNLPPLAMIVQRTWRGFLSVLDKFAFACVIGVVVRASAGQTHETNIGLLTNAKEGRATRLDGLEPQLLRRLLKEFDDFGSIQRSYLRKSSPLHDPKTAAAQLLGCAQSGNPHCQVMLGIYFREGIGVERDLEQFRQFTWLALRDHHHPIAFNNMLVVMHESAPRPYSELLNDLQHPENVDGLRAGCAR